MNITRVSSHQPPPTRRTRASSSRPRLRASSATPRASLPEPSFARRVPSLRASPPEPRRSVRRPSRRRRRRSGRRNRTHRHSRASVGHRWTDGCVPFAIRHKGIFPSSEPDAFRSSRASVRRTERVGAGVEVGVETVCARALYTRPRPVVPSSRRRVRCARALRSSVGGVRAMGVQSHTHI